jgi:hypothetical protein
MLNRLIIPGAKLDLENKAKSTSISSKSESVLSLQKRNKVYINFLTSLENIDNDNFICNFGNNSSLLISYLQSTLKRQVQQL